MKKIFSVLMTLCLLLSMIPAGVVAEGAAEYNVSTNIGACKFYTSEATEFTVTTYVSEGAEQKTVVGAFELYDGDGNKIENEQDIRNVVTLEYLEYTSGIWREFYGEFGPSEGFVMMNNITSTFKATFKNEGNYKVKVLIKDVNNEKSDLCQTEEIELNVVNFTNSLITTTLPAKIYLNQDTYFTCTTTANDHKNETVLGAFAVVEAADLSTVATLKYQDSSTGNWFEFYGDFGPATGFPLNDATSNFCVNFKAAGTYNVKIYIKLLDGTELCAVEKTVEVVKPGVLTTTLPDSFIAEEPTEYTVTTVANGDADRMVYGAFELYDSEGNLIENVQDIQNIVKLEYQESVNWYEFYGKFGPAGGFPLIDGATSNFKVTFKNGGNYAVKVLIKDIGTNDVVCETELKEISVTPKYKITVENGNEEEGTVQTSAEKVVAGESAEITVTAKEGYEIGAIFVNDVPQDVTDVKKTVFEVTPDGDVTVKATFIQLFTVQVTYDKNGNVTVNEQGIESGGSAIIKETDKKLTVEAEPNEGYRVVEFIINGEKQTVIPENGKGYTAILNQMQNYTIQIGFERNVYAVTVENDENVAIDVANPSHGDAITVTVNTPKGQKITKVLVNGEETKVTLVNVDNDPWEASFELTVTEDVTIAVEFKNAEIETEYTAFFNAGDAVTVKENDSIFVFKKNATVKFTTNKDYTQIYMPNGTALTQTTTVQEIWLRKDGEFFSWHPVQLPENGLQIVVDVAAPTITVGTEFNNEIIYNQDVIVPFEITDANAGVETVSYEVGYMDSGTFIKTEEGTSQIEDGYYIVPVTAEKNNRHGVVVKVTALDKAGNPSSEETSLNIDITKPEISVDWLDDPGVVENDEYYKNRTATIHIQERTESFDAQSINKVYINDEQPAEGEENYIYICAKNAKGDAVDFTVENLTWNTTTGNTPDEDVHSVTIPFVKDAVYTIKIVYTDKAGNKGDEYTAEFVVDTNDPTGEIVAQLWYLIATLDEQDEVVTQEAMTAELTWYDLIGELSFGKLSSPVRIDVIATAQDETSGVATVEYYKTAETKALTETDLNGVSEWTTVTKTEDIYNIYSAKKDERFTVYLKITDYAGLDTYISTDGLILDTEKPVDGEVVDKFAPQVNMNEINATDSTNGIYNENVEIAVNIMDPVVGNEKIFSGLQSVTYNIKAMDMEGVEENGELALTAETVKDTNDIVKHMTENVEKDENTDLVRHLAGKIVINSKTFNSNNVRLVVTAVDNAGNITTYEKFFKIDVTAPTIDVSYDNNRADSGVYFKNDRKATIVVTERNFNAEDVQITITNTDGVFPAITGWEKTEGTGNLDDTKWTATITYSQDGDYTFGINYTDLADNACEGARYGNSVAPTEFTIDKTQPLISVSYNNNSALNGKYFAEPRTATIVVTEHNFEASRVIFTRNGSQTTIPAGSWRQNGDVYTTTIAYNQDGNYTFEVTAQDKAGNNGPAANYGSSVAPKDFVVDQTIEKPVIEGVENGCAYKEDVIPSISFSDVNFDSYEVKLLRTRMGEKNVDVTEQFIKDIKETAQGGSGTFDTFEKIVENDGIYTLTVKIVDKAGNEATEECTFSVNRFGSVYEYSDELVALIKDGGQYVQSVDTDLVITEYNADKILEGSLKILITRDGESVDVDFTSNPEANAEVAIGESGWYQYVYTIKASNFETDGVYKISLASEYSTKDSEKNESSSVPENSIDKQGGQILNTMNFTVDSVAPEIRNIVNLDKKIADKDKIVDGKLNVKYTIVDVGGLKTIEIIVNGVTVQTLTAEDIAENAYNFTGSFDLSEQDGTNAHKVQIRVTDLAGNVTDTNSQEFRNAHSEDNENSTYLFFGEVTVSRNFFVRWYANTGLFLGSIGGVVVLATAVCFIVATKKKKKEEAAAK